MVASLLLAPRRQDGVCLLLLLCATKVELSVEQVGGTLDVRPRIRIRRGFLLLLLLLHVHGQLRDAVGEHKPPHLAGVLVSHLDLEKEE